MKNSWLQLGSIALAMVGCSGSGSSSATSDDYDDVAQSLSGVAATSDHGGEVGSFYDATLIAQGTPSAGLTLNAAGHLEGKHANLTYSYATTCEDASGTTLPTCGVTTDDASVKVSWAGELQTPSLTATIDHEASLRLVAIQSGTATLSGDGNFEADSHFMSAWRHVQRNFHLGYSVNYDAVQIRRLPLLVVGGAVHYSIDAERMASSDGKTADASFRMTADLQFSADGTAKLTLDGSHHYTIDMASGAVARSN